MTRTGHGMRGGLMTIGCLLMGLGAAHGSRGRGMGEVERFEP